jgi:cytochrome c-type biogenesis protein CcmH
MAPRSRCPARAASRNSGVRGRVRTAVVSLITLLALTAIVVVVLVRSLSPPETAAPTATAAGSGGPAAPEASERSSISGPVILAPELAGKVWEASVVFLIVRKASGPPFAVKRFPSPRFPLAYRVGAADVMMAGSPFEGEVRVSARVSQSGSAGPAQPGDLEGEHAAPVQVGARNVNVTIARVR